MLSIVHAHLLVLLASICGSDSAHCLALTNMGFMKTFAAYAAIFGAALYTPMLAVEVLLVACAVLVVITIALPVYLSIVRNMLHTCSRLGVKIRAVSERSSGV